MIKALSHLVIATDDVIGLSKFVQELFEIEAHYINEDFSDFVLPDKSRIAFFKPVGKAKKFFEVSSNPSQVSFGVTVSDVEKLYERLMSLEDKWSFEVSGKPKDHPWGEKSFLLIDPCKNRWEITQSPSDEGHLVDLD